MTTLEHSIAALDKIFQKAIAEIDRLQTINAELLASAKRVVDTQDDASRRYGDASHAITVLQAAIAKSDILERALDAVLDKGLAEKASP